MLQTILNNLKLLGDKPCLYTGGRYHTYSDIYSFVKKIYGYISLNCMDKRPVIVYGHKEEYMISSFLACVFMGIAYVPIDRSLPDERTEDIIEAVKPQLIIGNYHSSLCKSISPYEITESREIEMVHMALDDNYYIIFTSGSTGKPKGVEIMYKNVSSCVKWLYGICNPHNEVILNQADYSFDLSVGDIYTALYSGSCHYALDSIYHINTAEIMKHFEKSKGTIAVFTPSFAELLLCSAEFNEKLLPELKYMLFCGETLHVKTAKKLMNRFPNTKIINMYGPTEATFAVTAVEVSKDMLEYESLPLGIPKEDVNIIISDEDEIIIQGESVGRGYLEKSDSFIFIDGIRSYKTGDLGCIKNRLLYFKGRRDSQIKLKGYRIELGDIAENIEAIDYVEKAVVVPLMNKNNVVKKITAFVKYSGDNDIKKELIKKLPYYMIPDIIRVEAFPLTTNGKCDTNRLVKEFCN